MDTPALVDRDIAEGRRLVEALDLAHFPVTAAFWHFVPDECLWRLTVASPFFTEHGPRETYTRIQEILRAAGVELPLWRITALSPEDPLVTELRIFAPTEGAPFLGTTFLCNTMIGEVFLQGAYVYRAERIVGKNGTFELWCATPGQDRKVWIARKARVTVEDGFFKRVEVEGYTWPHTQARAGINIHLGGPRERLPQGWEDKRGHPEVDDSRRKAAEHRARSHRD
jgi:hypothetical protein